MRDKDLFMKHWQCCKTEQVLSEQVLMEKLLKSRKMIKDMLNVKFQKKIFFVINFRQR